jgi:AcrR family transcriptional regulator
MKPGCGPEDGVWLGKAIRRRQRHMRIRCRGYSNAVDIQMRALSNLAMATRLRRAEQVERNREIVLEAARRVFIDRGYGGASLEAIAEEAGFSRGVVYSQFGSKADMFFALLERRIEERAADNERIAAELTGAEALREFIRAAHLDTAAETGWSFVLTEFRALAMRDPQLNRRYADAHARTVDKFASVFERVFAGVGRNPPVPARSIAEFLSAAVAGIALERAANPDAIPDHDVAQLIPRALGLRGTEDLRL